MRLKKAPADVQSKFFASLSAEEAEWLWYDWDGFWARTNQKLPTEEQWKQWLVLAGRGFGKTRIGSQAIKKWALSGVFRNVNMMGATADDARAVMIEGDSGILEICNKHERPDYKKYERKLVWPNGAISEVFTADEPERLRGKQHNKLWCDEVCAWRRGEEALKQAILGLRLKARNLTPEKREWLIKQGIQTQAQVIYTTTPKPTKLLKKLVNDKDTVITKGSTFDNQDNLDPSYITQVISDYANTRTGRQELDGEILDDNPGASWTRELIEKCRAPLTLLYPPAGQEDQRIQFRRTVVAVDPAVSDTPDSDEIGIVVVGVDGNGHGYTIEDASMKGSPTAWATRVIEMFDKWSCDKIIAEGNNGGNLITTNIQAVRPYAPVEIVHARFEKQARAQPVANRFEQGRISHIGIFPKLEDEMCEFSAESRMKSPNRYDAMVWGYTYLLFKNQGDAMIAWAEREVEKLRARVSDGAAAASTQKFALNDSESEAKSAENSDSQLQAPAPVAAAPEKPDRPDPRLDALNKRLAAIDKFFADQRAA